MSKFDDVLNWLVPIIIIILFIAMMYVKIPEPFNVVGRWIRKLFGYIGDKTSEVGETKLVYKYE